MSERTAPKGAAAGTAGVSPAAPRATLRARRPRSQLLLLAIVSLALPALAQPPPTQLQAAPLAKAAGHPGPLDIEPVATSELSKGVGTPIWAVGIASADGSFGHAAVLLVEYGSFLSAGMRAGLEAAATDPARSAAAIRADLAGQLDRAAQPSDRTRYAHQLKELDTLIAGAALTRRVPLPNARVGFVTVLGFASAGGATTVAVLPSPDGRQELLVVTGGGLESEVRKPNDASAAYEKAMRESPVGVTDAMALVAYEQLFGVTLRGVPAPRGHAQGTATAAPR